MKLVLILSFAALVACDYSALEQGTPSNTYITSEKIKPTGGNIEPGKPFFNFKSFYQGAFPPARFPPTSFSSSTFLPLNYPYKDFNYATSLQGILPPISQIIPPQISQTVPPISQIIPPIFGNVKPALPTPSPVVPQTFSSQVLPPISNPLLSKFTFPYYSPLYQFPYIYPSAFSFPSATFPTQAQNKPSKNQQESLSTSYGPSASTLVEQESVVSDENSAPFDPSSVSFPYEPAAAEAQETVAPHKPAQEYGPPPSK